MINDNLNSPYGNTIRPRRRNGHQTKYNRRQENVPAAVSSSFRALGQRRVVNGFHHPGLKKQFSKNLSLYISALLSPISHAGVVGIKR